MRGAREYANLFETGQYGQLYITSGSHARGKTFRIQILPENEIAESNGQNNLCTNKNAIMVYGVISGNPGWSEAYGWLHRGKWCDDFAALCVAKKKEQTEERAAKKLEAQESAEEENCRVQRLLEAY